ncbi:MAG TPA: ABC transporter permease [Solirubrobacteraceae bacterium]|jgi:phospholipid/cholesterol/gamma-HCH transport system permease protein|nr:ABC transporter permease [Solirubrobacteraceae bacterium]
MATVDASETPERPVAPVRSQIGLAGAIREVGELTAFAGESARALPGALQYISETLRQTAIMIRGTTFLTFLLNLFFGAEIVNFLYFFISAIGAGDELGVVGYAAPRQLVTTMFCFIFSAKVGCGMTSELGTMRINQEIDAFESTGVDPMKYVVATRLAATLLFIPYATAISLLALYFGQYFDAITVLHGLAPASFSQVYWGIQTSTDQIFALVTIAVTALSTSTVACFYGLRTRGGPAAVGDAVARSVVINLVLGIVITSTFAAGFYGSNLHTALGGG